MSSTTAVKKPFTFVRYFGGKSGKLAAKIAASLPQHQNYIEPYGGAAGLLLNKKPSKVEVYNDLSKGMVTLFKVIRNPETLPELARALELTLFARDEWNDAQDSYNSPAWHDLPEVEQARVAFTILEQSRNGQFRNGGWRFGGPKHDASVSQAFYNKIDKLAWVSQRFRNVVIENKPALELMAQWENSKSFFYLDPPYPPESRGKDAKVKHRDYEHEMSREAHLELLAACIASKSMIIMSSYPTALYDEPLLAAGWGYQDYASIASSCMTTDGNGRKGMTDEKGTAKRVERVWFNSAATPRTLWNLPEQEPEQEAI